MEKVYLVHRIRLTIQECDLVTGTSKRLTYIMPGGKKVTTSRFTDHFALFPDKDAADHFLKDVIRNMISLKTQERLILLGEIDELKAKLKGI